MIKIFIGYDPKTHIDFHVLVQSIIDKADEAVEIIPLSRKHIPMWRPTQANQSNDFSFSRFLVPFLAGYQGQAFFMDSDMVMTNHFLFRQALIHLRPEHAVAVVKHNYTPIRGKKLFNYEQQIYPRKNWSSFMLFNCGHPSCLKLTPETVNNADAGWLHQLRWCADSEIGDLPQRCNVLIDEPDSSPECAIVPYNVHYTRGSPMHPQFVNTPRAEDWLNIYSTFALPHLGVVSGDIWRTEDEDSEGTEPQ